MPRCQATEDGRLGERDELLVLQAASKLDAGAKLVKVRLRSNSPVRTHFGHGSGPTRLQTWALAINPRSNGRLTAFQMGLKYTTSSTTHVSTGALFGIGVVNGTASRRTIATILLAWATTLPLGAALGALSLALLR